MARSRRSQILLTLLLAFAALGVTEGPEIETKARDELVLRLGNESNPADHAFGPKTYGFKGSHSFASGWLIEGVFVRLHEPGSQSLSSPLDEGRLGLTTPELQALGQAWTVTAEGWKNRTVDMYTNLGGLTLTHKGLIDVGAGYYQGNASRFHEINGFRGFRALLSTTLGPVDLSAEHVNGRILAQGHYRRTSFEAGVTFFASGRLPLTYTLGLEDRLFDFGPAGSKLEAPDEWILVNGLEIHLEKLF